MIVTGLAMPTGSPVRRHGRLYVFARGCFAPALARRSSNIRCLAKHDREEELGRLSDGSLRLWEADDGLRYECILTDSHAHQYWADKIGRGLVAGSSCHVEYGTVRFGGAFNYVREIAELRDVGPCSDPAHPGTWARVAHDPDVQYRASQRIRYLSLGYWQGW